MTLCLARDDHFMGPIEDEKLTLEVVRHQVVVSRATLNPRVTAGPVSLEGRYPETRVRIEVLVSDRGREDIVLDLWHRGPDGTIYHNNDLLMDVSLMLLEAQ